MKRVGKRKPWSSEAPVVAGTGVVAVAAEANGRNEANELMALGENDHTQLQTSVGGDKQGLDSDAEAEEEDDEGDEEEKEEGDGDAVGQDSERPKLADGFYEMEAIRRRRVRKGQLQYLIKWRGWPETANTWEPLENVQSCSDVIDAFEESLKLGRPRKRKRKNVVPHSQPKKKQNPRTSILSNSVGGLASNPGDDDIQSVPFNYLSHAHVSAVPQAVFSSNEGETIGVTSTLERAIPAENGNAISHSSDLRKEQNDYDPKLSELKVIASINGVDTDKPATYFQDCTASEASGASNRPSKVNGKEKVESSRCRGAKKRKSGSVKRFRKKSHETPNITGTVISDAANEHTFPDPMGNGSCPNTRIYDSQSSGIVKIIKAIGYSASMSSSTQDVSVSFNVLRSDGTEGTVDNKYLKANDPLLLINFYEQHLRYHT